MSEVRSEGDAAAIEERRAANEVRIPRQYTTSLNFRQSRAGLLEASCFPSFFLSSFGPKRTKTGPTNIVN